MMFVGLFYIVLLCLFSCFFFSSRRRHTRCYRDWSSDVCSSDLGTCLWVLAGLPAQSPPRPTSPSAVPSEGEGKAAKGEADPVQKRLADLQESLGFVESGLTKKVEDLMLFRRLEDVAMVDKVRYTGLPPRVVKNRTGQGAGNPIIINAYTF